MDVFKQRRNLIVTIIILVILNITAISLLIIGKPKHPEEREQIGNRKNEIERITKLLKEELNFTDNQAKEYLTLRREHRKNSQKVHREIQRLKTEMFDKVLSDDSNTEISDSLLQLAVEKQKKLEILTFEHLQKLKKLCTPNQQKELKRLMHRLQVPPRQGRPDGPTPRRRQDGLPPSGERPPQNLN